jgi:hypothetical protein
VLVESFDEAIGKENDHMESEVKRLKFEVNKLKKKIKVQPPQDNRSNMVKKLEKKISAPKVASQHQSKQSHHKKEEKTNIDEKIEYARNVFLNTMRPQIKNGIGYKSGDKHNSRVNSNGKELIKFTKANSNQEKKKRLNNTNHVSYASNANDSHVSHVLS